MKQTFELTDVSISSIRDGEVTVIKNNFGCSETLVFNNASVKSIVKGKAVIEVEVPFTKSDLEVGMIVQYHDGSKRMVLEADGEKFLSGVNGWQDLLSYNDDLTLRGPLPQHLTIDKVYSMGSHRGTIEDMINDAQDLIWSRY